MTKRAHEEYTRVWWVASIASIAAPTTAELAAGTDITAFTPKDGLKVGATNNAIKNDDLTSAFMPEIAGSYGNKINLTLFRDDSADTAWTLFKARKTAGNLVIRRLTPFTTAATAAQKVEVYPVQVGQPMPEDTSENERIKFSVEMFVTATPNLDATLA